jgi:hypothetical protein
MKYKNNIILDVYSNKNFKINYWIYNFNITNISVPKALNCFIKIYKNNSLKYDTTTSINTFKSNNNIFNLFNLFFLKKERIYTKLKYSRSPQYDIVSGGLAAFLAGFFGFLITEKFGLELVDSGDFYFLFIYVVFLCMFLKLFLKIININDKNWSFLSVKWLFDYYRTLLILFFKKLKVMFNIFKIFKIFKL